jgi:hypothetical protein
MNCCPSPELDHPEGGARAIASQISLARADATL